MPQGTKISLALLVFAVLLGVRLLFLFQHERSQTLPRFIGSTASVSGTVADDPDVRESAVRIMVRVRAIGDEEGSGTLLAVLPKDTAVFYGDTVVVEGKLEAPRVFLTDTGRVFDYPGYLRVRGVSALMNKAQLREREPAGFSIRGSLFSLKHAFKESLERVLPQEDSALLEGILLGERRGLPKTLTDAFTIASLIHVVVLSGYNISIVAEATLRALRRLPRTFGYALAIGLMACFVLMTGGGSTALRASLMALIAILARYVRRPAAAMRALCVAGAVLVLINPLVVFHDPSFILSMLATFGLIALSPWVERRLPKFLNPQLRSIAASTVAVQLYLLPALLYFTGVFSLVALPANVLVLPLVPFAMLMGFLAGLLGFVSYYLALVPALMSDLVLRWMMWVAETSAYLPLSHTTVPAFPAWVAILLYVPLSIFAWRMYARAQIEAGDIR